MSDDEEPGRPDETHEFSPFEDESESRPNGGPRTGDAAADRTEEMPPAAPDEDATQESPRPPRRDTTAELPAAGDAGAHTARFDRGADAWADDGDRGWSGRAGVRPPSGYDDDGDGDWAAVSSGEPHGKWWMPILVGIVGLALLAVLGWGIYLIVQSSGDAATPPAVTTTAPPALETTPTTAAPTTTPATTEPTSSVPPPRDITVPALKGLSEDEARAALDRKLLRYRLRYVTSDYPAGTVIDSDPAEGQQVPADTVISLIVAIAPTTSAAPTQTAASAAPTDQPDGD
ncbi:PASTA domain-containing protein [Actinoplanes sp. NPDC026623]|uniref:PASTA domain-containing protein n=1 Tax=Actinoplanes sp. NPDC026623 TaxID=3155610 RepID=UPI0033EA2126